MAPMNASVVLTFNAVKKNGSMFGTRSLLSTWRSFVAYERISSRAEGWTWVRPRVTLTVIGKNTRSAAIIILENGSRTPNQLLRIGAIAINGTALAPTANGSRIPRVTPHRAVTNATA